MYSKKQRTNPPLREGISANEVTFMYNDILKMINLTIEDFLLRDEHAREQLRKTGQGQL